jgi:hypothetical protein
MGTQSWERRFIEAEYFSVPDGCYYPNLQNGDIVKRRYEPCYNLEDILIGYYEVYDPPPYLILQKISTHEYTLDTSFTSYYAMNLQSGEQEEIVFFDTEVVEIA